jgi:N-acetylmuramoyl-L-alanine amidase
MKLLKMSDVKYIVVHCAATNPKMDIGVDKIREWHLERGFLDVGYHFVIRRNGGVEYGRDITTPGAHARGFNRSSIGVCLVGGVDKFNKPKNNFTDEQFESLKKVVEALKESFPEAEVLGHRDLPDVKKACPSFDVKPWYDKEFNNQ